MPVVAGFETPEGGQNDAAGFGRVSAGEVVHILVRFGVGAVGGFQASGTVGCGLMIVDGLFHDFGSDAAPF